MPSSKTDAQPCTAMASQPGQDLFDDLLAADFEIDVESGENEPRHPEVMPPLASLVAWAANAPVATPSAAAPAPLRPSIDGVQRMITDLEVALNQMIIVNRAHERDLAAAAKAHHALAEERDALLARVSLLEDEVAATRELCDELTQAQDDVEAARGQNITAADERTALAREQRELEALTRLIQSERDLLLEENAMLEQQLRVLLAHNRELENARATLACREATLRQAVETAGRRVEALVDERKRLLAEVDEAKTALITLQREIEQAETTWRLALYAS
jgi:chromosome segregation ATPase